MIEHHTWITLVSEPDDERISSEILDDIVIVASKLGDVAQFEVSVINGIAMLRGCGAANHSSAHRELLSDLCSRILELAPLSYGLVHFWDDDVSDCFEVWVVRNGALRRELDPFSLAQGAN